MKKETFLKRYDLTEDQFSGKETVGISLDLRSLTSIPEGFNPTVGGSLYLGSSSKPICSTVPKIKIKRDFFWTKNKKRFALIDGLFCEILSEKIHTKLGEDFHIFSAKKVNKNSFFYIANKNNFYAHGEDLKKAFDDLDFKIIAEKIKSEPINKDTVITIQHYRIITGACDMGVREWMKEHKIKTEEIMAGDLLPILRKTRAYGLERFEKLITF